jgi:chromate transporter
MIYWELFTSFFKVGLLGFGGGLAIVRLIYDSIQPFLDMSREMFANIVAISQITPGPLAVNTATYVGYEAAGIAGAASATFGVILPAFIIVSIVVRMIQQFQNSIVVQGALKAIRPATMGLIGAAVVTLIVPAVAGDTRLGAGLISKLGLETSAGIGGLITGSPVDIAAILMVAATVVLMTRFKKSPFIVLIIMGCIGAILGV